MAINEIALPLYLFFCVLIFDFSSCKTFFFLSTHPANENGSPLSPFIIDLIFLNSL